MILTNEQALKAYKEYLIDFIAKAPDPDGITMKPPKRMLTPPMIFAGFEKNALEKLSELVTSSPNVDVSALKALKTEYMRILEAKY